MRLLFKELKKSIPAVIAIIILLFTQAVADLSLPSYTSDIVNVGIQQGGITSNVPDMISVETLNGLAMILSDAEREVIFNHFIEDKFEDKDIYKWDGLNQEELEAILIKPVIEMMSMQMGLGEEVKDNFDALPDTIIKQAGIEFVKQEYEALGMNIQKIQTNYIIKVGSKMIALALLVMATAICITFLASRVAAKMGKDLRGSVFSKVVGFSNNEMDKFSTASLITRSTNDIQQVQMLAIMFLRMVLYAPIMAVGGVLKILNTNLSMAWILVAGVGAILITVGIAFGVAMPKFKQMQTLVDRINLVMRETLIGLPVIRAFSTEKYEENRFDKANVDLTKNNLFVNRTMTFMMPTMMLLMNLISILIVWVGASHINNGAMQVGDMMAFIQYTMQIIMSFLMLTMVSVVLPRASVSADRINEILKYDISISDPDMPKESKRSLKGVVEFKDVSFRYPNAKEYALADLNFVTKPGETTAIIGSTGSGKSTLLNLIPRLYDVTDGKITVSGVDIRNQKQKDLRDKIGYVPQKGILFSGTIKSNIKFGNKKISDDAMEDSARIAQATDFIEATSQQYDNVIAQGGTNVSGGQKQRLSIARAIAINPDIYLFDDSFSALDFKTDRMLRTALKKVTKYSSVIIVAQRVSTIMDADQILVLDEGKIVGKGKHRELLDSCEVYRQIATSQLSKEELNYG